MDALQRFGDTTSQAYEKETLVLDEDLDYLIIQYDYVTRR